MHARDAQAALNLPKARLRWDVNIIILNLLAQFPGTNSIDFARNTIRDSLDKIGNGIDKIDNLVKPNR